jgi:hypothetical protein
MGFATGSSAALLLPTILIAVLAMTVGAVDPGSAWSSPLRIDGGFQSYRPRVAVGGTGDAMVAYEVSGSNTDIGASRFSERYGWDVPFVIDDRYLTTSSPFVAMDDAGNALVVWSWDEGDHQRIWSRRWVSGQGWENATIASGMNGTAYVRGISMTPGGTAFVVWNQNYSIPYCCNPHWDVWGNVFDPFVGWGTPTLLENDDSGPASAAGVAADPGGNATALWTASNGTRNSAWAAHYTPVAGWGGPEFVGTSPREMYPHST